jgi:hypothetical protein
MDTMTCPFGCVVGYRVQMEGCTQNCNPQSTRISKLPNTVCADAWLEEGYTHHATSNRHVVHNLPNTVYAHTNVAAECGYTTHCYSNQH